MNIHIRSGGACLLKGPKTMWCGMSQQGNPGLRNRWGDNGQTIQESTDFSEGLLYLRPFPALGEFKS